MLDSRTVALATSYWATHFGCGPSTLFSHSRQIVPHGPELADYAGVFVLFRETSAVISLPADRFDALQALLPNQAEAVTPTNLSAALASVSSATIGPAWIGYRSSTSGRTSTAQTLTIENTAAREALRQSCPTLDWEHGGGTPSDPAAGVFADGQLVSIATYQVWGGTIAHISVVTHPDYRGRGYGRDAVAHLADRAIRAGLLPQYRTLVANQASIHIAESLGFGRFAESLAIRL